VSKSLSPLVSLATSMHSQPGVYALLLGSGVSTGAGLPTGWGVVTELVARVAAASAPSDEGAVAAARDDPEAWWSENGAGKLGYSTLLEQLAPSAAARQGLLAKFFEPHSEEDELVGEPTRAHRAIAELVRRGSVRVIVTTNFDRLLERALESVGVAPQVIARPEAVNGMAPLAHAPATIIKLHGDYKDLGSRNTPSELSAYPDEWSRLLAQTFDEYGLVISGWSAGWDTALVAALEAAPSRRYPLYWDERSSRGTDAQRLLAVRAGQVVPASSADELFGELVESVEALDKMSAPPLTTAMAVARLKRYLPDPVRRIDLDDLVTGAVDEVEDLVVSAPVNGPPGGVTGPYLDELYEAQFQSMEQLAQLLITGVWHDDGTHDRLWLDVVQRLVRIGSSFPSSFNSAVFSARSIPVLTALAVISITATRRNREGLLISLGTEVEGQRYPGSNETLAAAQMAHYVRIFENEEVVNALPSSGTTRWTYPASHYFSNNIRRYFPDLSDRDFTAAYRGFEYRLGLLQQHTEGYKAASGEYVGETGWRDGKPVEELEFDRQVARGYSEPWKAFFLKLGLNLEGALQNQREVLGHYRRWR